MDTYFGVVNYTKYIKYLCRFFVKALFYKKYVNYLYIPMINFDHNVIDF